MEMKKGGGERERERGREKIEEKAAFRFSSSPDTVYTWTMKYISPIENDSDIRYTSRRGDKTGLGQHPLFDRLRLEVVGLISLLEAN